MSFISRAPWPPSSARCSSPGRRSAALSLLLPHPSSYDAPGLWSNVVLAYVAGVVLLLLRNRLPGWSLPLIVLAGTAVVTRAVYYGHDPSGYYTIWYLWIGVYAFFFFGLRWGLIQMAAVGAAYGWVLTEIEGPTPVARWVVTVGSILVAGLLVDALGGTAPQRDGRLRQARREPRGRRRGGQAARDPERPPSGGLGDLLGGRPDGARIRGGALAAESHRRRSAGDRGRGRRRRGRLDPVRHPELGCDPGLHLGDRPLRSAARRQVRPGALAGLRGRRGALAADPPRQEHGGRSARGLLARAARAARRGDHAARSGCSLSRRRSRSSAASCSAGSRSRLGPTTSPACSTAGPGTRSSGGSSPGPTGRAARSASRSSTWTGSSSTTTPTATRRATASSSRWPRPGSQTLRAGDIIARYGGEEFAVALPGTNLEHAQQMLERLRGCLPEGQTCSAGVCRWDGSESAESLTARADTALYSAKEAGREPGRRPA